MTLMGQWKYRYGRGACIRLCCEGELLLGKRGGGGGGRGALITVRSNTQSLD